MADARYIQVILPLRLEWEPYYRLPEGLDVQVGDRVRALFAGAFYVAVVSAVGVAPTLDPARIMPLEGVEKDLPPITKEEIAFWRILAQYYLCEVGEVYKAAYPLMKHHKSRLALPEQQEPVDKLVLSPEEKQGADAAGQAEKTVLLKGNDRINIYLKLALDTYRSGRSVLLLVPEIAFSGQLAEQVQAVFPSALLYHSKVTPGKKKQVAQMLRSGEPYVVLGTRSALFLPHQKLGLVIVDEEHDSSYKQDAPAPRFHTREAAIMLAGIHGARVILGSATPSLDSIYNAQIGRFERIELKNSLKQNAPVEIEIVDIGAEYRKRGMAGSFSLKLLERIQQTLQAGEQVLLVTPRRTSIGGRKMEEEVLEFCPSARIAILDGTAEDQAETIRSFAAGEFDILLGNSFLSRGFESPRLNMVAILAADGILSRQDFRADERALQVLEQFKDRCRHFVIQTREPKHPLFVSLSGGEDITQRMLEERRVAGYPPFTRMVKLLLRDPNEKRLQYMSRELCKELAPLGVPVEGSQYEIRILLPRDKALTCRKEAIGQTVDAFEKKNKYMHHIVIDVDPV